jgi:hypothetical protein
MKGIVGGSSQGGLTFLGLGALLTQAKVSGCISHHLLGKPRLVQRVEWAENMRMYFGEALAQMVTHSWPVSH